MTDTMLRAGATFALTDEQTNAIRFIAANLKIGLLALSGPAGSGKTTLLRELVAYLEDQGQKVTVAATTNKAAYVLRTKDINAVTFHQACMRPVFRPPLDKLGRFLDQAECDDYSKVDFPKSLLEEYAKEVLLEALTITKQRGIYAAFRQLGIKDIFKYIESWLPAGPQEGVLIIDEASMLGEKELRTGRDVFSKIVLVGDEFQLPPVKSSPVFWEVPDRVRLTQIHRQAAGSQPLIIATKIRENVSFSVQAEEIDTRLSAKGIPVIVWKNATRIALTKAIRAKLGLTGKGPQPGEVLICRNGSDRAAKQMGLINNSLWRVVESDGYRCTLENDQGSVLEDISILIEEFDKGDGIPFRFAYALTCHNSQGSQWSEVMIHHPDALAHWAFNKEDAKKWLYTAVTRAVSQAIFVTDKVV